MGVRRGMRIDMDNDRNVVLEGVVESVFDILGDLMTRSHRQVWIDGNRDVETQLMTLPSDPQIADPANTFESKDDNLGIRDDLRLNPIEESADQTPGRSYKKKHDDYGDH